MVDGRRGLANKLTGGADAANTSSSFRPAEQPRPIQSRRPLSRVFHRALHIGGRLLLAHLGLGLGPAVQWDEGRVSPPGNERRRGDEDVRLERGLRAQQHREEPRVGRNKA